MSCVYQALAQKSRAPSDKYADVARLERYELVLLYTAGIHGIRLSSFSPKLSLSVR